MTPLALLADTRIQNQTRVETQRHTTVAIVARPAGVLHAYVGTLTPAGRCPRGARPACGVRTRALREVPLAEVRRRRVCGRCHAHLDRLGKAGEVGTQPRTRSQLLTAYAGVTAFDLAVDAWRAETSADVERVEWLALLLVGYPAVERDQVVSPDGKVTGSLDEHIAQARLRLGITRDYLGEHDRAVARENELVGQMNVRAARKDAWKDRESRVTRLGINNALPRPRRSA